MTIEECWEKYKHLDYLLSDEEWMLAYSDEMSWAHSFFAQLYDCWQAIRDEREKLYDAQRERENKT